MKILIVTNHSYMFYRFRKELLEALLRDNEVVLSIITDLNVSAMR